MVDCSAMDAWVESKAPRMEGLLVGLVDRNSYSQNTKGLAEVGRTLRRVFEKLGADTFEASPADSADAMVGGELADGPAPVAVPQTLVWRKHPVASPGETPRLRVLLVIHYDTVYPPVDPATKGRFDGPGIYKGPGAADAKGGIVVLLYSLLALEASAWAGKIAWTVALNPDEEIGSPTSSAKLVELAEQHDLALVFEPAPSAHLMAVARKGSGNFQALFKGRAAHAGREIEKGRNAVLAAARFALDATAAVMAMGDGASINVGKISGGGPVNVVPDRATVEFNVRATTPAQAEAIEKKLASLIEEAQKADGISAELRGAFSSPPWVQSAAGRAYFEKLQARGRELGLSLEGMISGGASDANKIAIAGIPVLDSLGPVGGAIHSAEEYVEVNTLVERVKLVAGFLAGLAAEGV